MLNVRRLLVSMLVLALAFAGVGSVFAQENNTPSLTVEDQALYITVATVNSDGPGWVVVHADANGSPGEVIGYAQVQDGQNTDVEVELDPNLITETLHVMLHEDTGEEGVFDFPDADPPVQVDGETLTTTITLQSPEDVDVDPDVDPTPTPVDNDIDDNDVDDNDVDAAEVEETPTPTATPEDEVVVDEEVDATPTPEDEVVVDEEVDATPLPDDEEAVEVIPELGANVSMLPMLGLAAAGALLLGVGFIFAYRKED